MVEEGMELGACGEGNGGEGGGQCNLNASGQVTWKERRG